MLLSACSSVEERPDPFDFPEIDDSIAQPMKRCVWPDTTEAVLDGEKIVYVSDEGFTLLKECRIIATANLVVAEQNAVSAEALVDTALTIQQMAKLQRDLDAWKLEQAKEERRRLQIENWAIKLAILLGLGAAATR